MPGKMKNPTTPSKGNSVAARAAAPGTARSAAARAAAPGQMKKVTKVKKLKGGQ